MTTWTLFILAIGLSMDAFAVSISDGMSYRNLSRIKALIIAAMFGLFQGIMPAIGYLAGTTFSSAVQNIDHWVALILLGFIGGKMIWEAVGEMRSGEEEEPAVKEFSFKVLFLQAVATSIDALAVGVSFALMNVNIVTASSFIAVVTFLCCVVGVFAGTKLGNVLKNNAEIFGGVILVFLGIKIFCEHMFFS